MKHLIEFACLAFMGILGLVLGLRIQAIECECPPAKAEFYGTTIIDADHIERTWIYRDTVEYARPKIKFTL